MAVNPRHPSSERRPATTAVHSVIVDTRNRELPSPNTDFTYDLHETYDGVTAIQLGDFALPPDPRFPIDTFRRHYGVAGPMYQTVTTSISVQEIVQWNEITPLGTDARGQQQSRVRVASVTTLDGATLFLPPTFNTVTAAAAVGTTHVELTTAVPHRLTNVFDIWPEGLRAEVPLRCTRYEDGDPTLSAGIVLIPANNKVQIPVGVLGSLTSDLNPTLSANFRSGTLTSFLETPRLTPSEAADAMDRWLGARYTDGTFRVRYRATLDSLTGRFEFGPNGGHVQVSHRGGGTVVRADTRARVTVHAGDYGWRLGMQELVGGFVAPWLANAQVNPNGLFVSEDTAPLRTVPLDLKTVELPIGSYTRASLTDLLTERGTPLWVADWTEPERTIYLNEPSGTFTSVTLDPGWYFPSLLASNTTARMNSLSGTSDMLVTYESLTGRFRFEQTAGQVFGLDFTPTQSERIARALGFRATNYAGSSSYTSEFRAVCAQNAIPTDRAMRRPLRWTAEAPRRMLGFASDDLSALQTWEVASLNKALQFTELSDGNQTPFVNHFQQGDVLHVGGYSVLVTSEASLGGAPHAVSLTTGAASSQLGGGSPEIAQILARPALDFFAQPWPHGSQLPEQDFTGYAVSAGALLPADTVGTGAAYGAVTNQLGFGGVLRGVSTGYYRFLDQYLMAPPLYAMLELRLPRNVSLLRARAAGASTGEDVLGDPADGSALQVLCKFLLTRGFARITEEITYVDLAGPTRVREVRLRLMDPDGRPVDMHGAEYVLSLLLRTLEGAAVAPVRF